MKYLTKKKKTGKVYFIFIEMNKLRTLGQLGETLGIPNVMNVGDGTVTQEQLIQQIEGETIKHLLRRLGYNAQEDKWKERAKTKNDRLKRYGLPEVEVGKTCAIGKILALVEQFSNSETEEIDPELWENRDFQEAVAQFFQENAETLIEAGVSQEAFFHTTHAQVRAAMIKWDHVLREQDQEAVLDLGGKKCIGKRCEKMNPNSEAVQAYAAIIATLPSGIDIWFDQAPGMAGIALITTLSLAKLLGSTILESHLFDRNKERSHYLRMTAAPGIALGTLVGALGAHFFAPEISQGANKEVFTLGTSTSVISAGVVFSAFLGTGAMSRNIRQQNFDMSSNLWPEEIKLFSGLLKQNRYHMLNDMLIRALWIPEKEKRDKEILTTFGIIEMVLENEIVDEKLKEREGDNPLKSDISEISAKALLASIEHHPLDNECALPQPDTSLRGKIQPIRRHLFGHKS